MHPKSSAKIKSTNHPNSAVFVPRSSNRNKLFSRPKLNPKSNRKRMSDARIIHLISYTITTPHYSLPRPRHHGTLPFNPRKRVVALLRHESTTFSAILTSGLILRHMKWRNYPSEFCGFDFHGDTVCQRRLHWL